MAKYIIKWNTGYGDNYDEVEAKDEEEAEQIAYEAWRSDVEDQADYEAMEWTEELAEDYL